MRDLLTDKIDEFMTWVVPDPDECRRTAAEMAAREPNVPKEVLARSVVAYARKKGLAIGGVTGIASSPLTFLPAAMADIAATLRVEGTMAGVVAALLDPESLDAPERFRADVIAVVFPAALSQALRQLGIRVGEEVTKTLVRRLVTKGGFEAIAKLAGRFLGTRMTAKALASKGVPLVGMGIGAGWNYLEVGAVGARAIAYHTGQPVGVGKLREMGRRLIPERFRRRVAGGAGAADSNANAGTEA
ncbi:MAG TPA: hypothetical protein VF796_13390 [Humisphaera sp.]